MTADPVRTVFLGSGGFGRESLRRLARHPGVDLVGVVTAPPRPAGRKAQERRTVIDDLANELAVPAILRPPRLRSDAAIAEVLALDPGLVVLADYGQIVPAPLLERPHGALNLHPSLLPRHRGATPIPAAILAGDAETGVTLMRMDAGLDTGPIVAQARVALDGTETTPELEARLADVAADLLERSLAPWLAGELPAVAQAVDGATLTRPLRRDDGRLDPARPAAELVRQVRAYRPWPGTFVETDAGRLVVHAAEALESDATPAGTFSAAGMGTVDGTLRLLEVQPAGGLPMPWSAYLRGRPGIVGSRVVAAG